VTACDHSDDRDTCPVCQRSAAPRTPDPWGPPFAARYAGTCDGCPNPIDPGDSIRACEGEYRHTECV
jgi:hypothetical protein